MADNDLTLKIVIDDAGAKQKLQEDDRALDSLGQTAKKTGAAVSDYEKRVKATVQAHQASTKAIDTHTDSLSSLVTQLGLSQHALYDNTAAAAKYAEIATLLGGALVAVGVAVGFAAEKLYEMAASAAKVGDGLSDLVDKFGGSAYQVSALSSAVTIAGGSMEKVASATATFQQRMVEGSTKFEEGMRRVKLSVDDLKAAAPDQQFLLVASAIRSVQDPAERTAAAVELFGRQGKELMPLLLKPLDELVAKAKELGLVWSEVDTKAAEEFEMASRQLHLQIEQLEITAGRKLIPTFRDIVTVLPDVANNFVKGADDGVLFDTMLAGMAKNVLWLTSALDLLAGRTNAPNIGGATARNLGQIKADALDKSWTAEAFFKKQWDSIGTYSSMPLPITDTASAVRDLTAEYDKQQAAAKKAAAAALEHAKNLEEYTNASKSYSQVLDQIGNDLYEGIAADVKRGVSTKALVDIWKTSATEIDNVRAVENKWDDGLNDILKSMAENEEATGKFQQSLGKLLVGYDAAGKVVVGFTGILHTVDPALIQNAESLVQMQQRLKETEDAFRKTFGAFAELSLGLPAGLQPTGQVQAAFDPVRTATKDLGSFGQELGDIVRQLNSVGNSSDSAFGRVLHMVSLAITAVQTLDKAMKVSGLGSIDPGASPAGTAGGANVAGAAGGLAIAGGGAAAATAAGGGSATVAAATASALTIVGAWVAVGVAVYSFVSALREANKEAEKLYKIAVATKEVLADFKVSTPFSDALGQQLADTKENFAHITALNTAFKTHNELLAEAQRLGIDVYGPRMGRNAAMLSDAEIAAKVNLKANDAYLTELAQAAHLPDIIKELGGVSALTADQLEMVQTRAGQLFDLYKLGGPIAAAAVKTMDDTLIQFTQNLEASGGVVSQFFLDMVERARAAGIVLPQVAQFERDQAKALATGLSDLLAQPMIVSAAAVGKAVIDAQKAVDDLTATGKASASDLTKSQDALTDALTVQHREAERNQDAMRNLGYEAVLAFDAAIASGSNFMQALQGISGQLGTLQQAYKDLGLDIDDAAIKGLLLENTILNGTADKPSGLGKAISGLQAIFTAAQNIPGLMTPDMFKAQQGTLGSLYEQTQAATAAAGGSTINALLPFQQTLHEMQEYAKKNNLALDAKTQMLIDQSKELGIWTDDFKSDSEKTRESIADLIKSNYDLIVALGGSGRADGNPPPTSGTTPPIKQPPEPGVTTPPFPIPIPMAAGGVGFAGGPMSFSTRGNEEYAFSGEGRRFQRSAAGSSGPQPPSMNFYMTFNNQALNPDGLAEIVEHQILPQAIGLIEDRVRDFNERLFAAAPRKRS